MNKHLYFVCPTDCLETVINQFFDQENYFYTSLANSITFDQELVDQINRLIEVEGITAISFVLSNNNQIVKSITDRNKKYNTKVLNALDRQIIRCKRKAEFLWKRSDVQPLTLAYYLSAKARELQLKINHWLVDSVHIDVKIYHWDDDTFQVVCTDLFAKNLFNLN